MSCFVSAICELRPLQRRLARRDQCIVPVDGFFEWKAIKGQKEASEMAVRNYTGSLK
jgi:putative SOS response-associated peptidase YedK